MPYTQQLAVLTTVVVAVPVLAFRRRLLLNPATYVLLVVLWSVLFKTLYISRFRRYPSPTGHDMIYIGASSPEFLAAGLTLALLAMIAYVSGFLIMGPRTFAGTFLETLRRLEPPAGSRRTIALLTVSAMVAFLLYLVASDTSFFTWPFSAKRFAPEVIGAPSRFHYPPYYLFKISLTSGSIAYAAALVLFQARGGQGDRVPRGQFAVVFLLALTLSHFASLRLLILLVLLQVLLLMYYLRAWRQASFMSLFVLLTAASFLLITLLHRAPEREVERMVQAAARPRATPAQEAPRAVVRPARPRADAARPAGPDPGSAKPDETQRVEATAGAAPRSEPPQAAQSVLERLATRIASASFEGRYFMDASKLAHIASHYPAKRSFLLGAGFIGLSTPPFAEGATGGPSISRYLARSVFQEPRNSVPPGFAGELYLNFSWPGVALGFLVLGTGHRLLLNHLLLDRMPILVAACLVVLIPNTTLVLLNSGLLPAVSRSVIDIAILLLVQAPIWLRRGGPAGQR